MDISEIISRLEMLEINLKNLKTENAQLKRRLSTTDKPASKDQTLANHQVNAGPVRDGE